MKEMAKIDTKNIKLGMKFSAPVFFDDGENMFLAEEKSVKSYHIAAINRWNIEYLVTYGHEITDKDAAMGDEDIVELEEVEELESVS
ncbi:MAG: phosphohydrolase [Treponema sp.]|nr:phosphohydrolase [Candidatus Treponema equifaecale]